VEDFCKSCFVYGAHCLSIKPRDIAFMESFQNTHIKRIFGFPKRFHHTKLILTLDIKGIDAQIQSFKWSLTVLSGVQFKVDSISRDFDLILHAKFISGEAPGVCTYWRFLLVSSRPQFDSS
jgi:hypothetical protein